MGFLQKIKTSLRPGPIESAKNMHLGDNVEKASLLIDEGNTQEDQGAVLEALRLYEDAILLAPNYARAYTNKGNALCTLGALEKAISSYSQALSIDPNNAKLYYNMGNALQANKQYDLALDAFETSLKLEPVFADAWLAHANNLGDMGKPDLAIESYLHSLRIDPKYFQVHHNLGLNYYAMGEYRNAKQHLEAAIDIQPDAIVSYIELSNVYRALGDIDSAISAAQKACDISPQNASAKSLLLFCLMHSPDISRSALFSAHLDFGKRFDRSNPAASFFESRDINPLRTLQIGVVSPDLHNHSVASFFAPVYQYLSKTPGLVFHIYYTGIKQDPITQNLRRHSAHWIDASQMEEDRLEKQIRTDAIDILIDLSGHTPGHRLTMFGKRPAPIQMSWIGYPGTTGMASIDYYIGDRHFLPLGEFDDLFSEQIIRLPATAPFRFADELPEINGMPALTNGSLTFGSFNRMDKINPPVVALWSRLLLAIPDAKLLMGGLPVEGELGELLSWFSGCGIDRSRLILHPRSNMHNYLRLHHDVDVCLDTFPYGGSTTTCHALTMGVPTITLAGETPISNAGRATLSQVGIEHLFAAMSEDDFVSKGVWCSQNISELVELRQTLRQRTLGSNLTNPEAIANAFTVAVRHAWRRSCEGLLPETFETVERGGKFEVLPG